MSGTATHISPAARLQFVGAVARSFILFAYQWLVARVFGAGPFGTMNLALSGFQTATMLGRAAGDNIVLRGYDEAERNTTLAVGVTLSLVAGTIAGVALAAWGFWLAHGDITSPVSVSFALVAIAVPAAAVLFPLGAALRRAQRFSSYTWTVTLLEPLCRTVLVAVAIALGAHWINSVVAISISASIAALVAVLTQRTILRIHPQIRTTGGIRQLLVYSGTQTVASAINTGFLFAQLTILSLLGRDTDTGLFAAAGRIAMLALWGQWAFSAPFTPMIAANLAKPEGIIRLNSAYRIIIASVLWLNAPFLVGMIVAAPAILAVFGPGFEKGAALLAILAIGQWVNSATALAEEFLPLSHRSSLALVNNVGALIFLVLLGIPLGARYGAVGVAVAASATLIALNVLRAAQVQRMFGVLLPLRTVGIAGLASILGVATSIGLAWSWAGRPVMQFAAGMFAAVLTASVMWVLGGADERLALKSLLRGERGPAPSANGLAR